MRDVVLSRLTCQNPPRPSSLGPPPSRIRPGSDYWVPHVFARSAPPQQQQCESLGDAGAVQKVLDSCDRTSAVGRRNYAILLSLARLGLRAGEIIALQLEDIDWQNAQITVRSRKGCGWARLPLPKDMGKAIARYLQIDRPDCSSRNVFVRRVAPYQRLSNSAVISVLTRNALKKAGIQSVRKGAHLFRHTLATEILRQGASLDEIAQVLRHKNPDTTAIYAKVDLDALRRLAIAWPGVVP